jgi:hypothetical protein
MTCTNVKRPVPQFKSQRQRHALVGCRFAVAWRRCRGSGDDIVVAKRPLLGGGGVVDVVVGSVCDDIFIGVVVVVVILALVVGVISLAAMT